MNLHEEEALALENKLYIGHEAMFELASTHRPGAMSGLGLEVFVELVREWQESL